MRECESELSAALLDWNRDKNIALPEQFLKVELECDFPMNASEFGLPQCVCTHLILYLQIINVRLLITWVCSCPEGLDLSSFYPKKQFLFLKAHFAI